MLAASRDLRTRTTNKAGGSALGECCVFRQLDGMGSLTDGPVLPGLELGFFSLPLNFPIFQMNGLATRLSGKEIAKHNSRESCWIIVHGAVRSP